MYLASAYAVRNLTVINLGQCHIGDEGFKHLTVASFLSNLNKLHVNDNGLTHLSALYLAESSFLTKLRYLYIGKNKLTQQGV